MVYLNQKLREGVIIMNKVEKLMIMVQEVNSWDGSLDNLEVWENGEDFFEMMYPDSAYEVARAIHFGDYNFMHEFVTIDVYGKLLSYSEWEYKEEILAYEEEIIERYKELVEEGSVEDYHDFLSEEN